MTLERRKKKKIRKRKVRRLKHETSNNGRLLTKIHGVFRSRLNATLNQGHPCRVQQSVSSRMVPGHALGVEQVSDVTWLVSVHGNLQLRTQSAKCTGMQQWPTNDRTFADV